jgi:hypothetical protein
MKRLKRQYPFRGNDMNPQETIDYAEKVDKLGELCDLQYDELGELWEILVNLWNHQDYFINPEFLPALLKEIDAQLENIQQNAKIEIIDKTETRTYKNLQWNDDYV